MNERTSRDGAFTEYVEARGAALRRTAVHLCAGDEAAADDLLQNTLIRAYLSWSRVRSEDARDRRVGTERLGGAGPLPRGQRQL
jgi:DNA-directed RNA polymerase specialized sigma24 family protein